MKLRSVFIGLALGLSMVALAACANVSDKATKSEGDDQPAVSREITIYSGRKEKYIKPVIKEFEKQTGISVKLLVGDGSQLANQLVEEKNNPRADVFITNDAGTLGYLVDQALLEKYESAATKRVLADLKDRNGMWVGASARARVIMYNTNLVKENEAPKSLLGLADPKWKGKFGITNSSNESMTGHVSAMRIVKGDDFTEKWLRDVKANDPVVLKSHDPLRDAIASGELSLGLVNHYYFQKKKAEGAPVGVVYPDQDDFGTFINIAGVALVKGAKDEASAKKFIDFVLSDKIQKIFAGVNKEMPVVDSVPTVDTRPLDDFKRADVNLDELGKELDKTLEMMERVGL